MLLQLPVQVESEASMNEKLNAILAELRSRSACYKADRASRKYTAVSEAMPKAYRLVKMVRFGSQARGDADAGSDIDVLVVLKGQELAENLIGTLPPNS
jgi:predicted nucleotidyltransferase